MFKYLYLTKPEWTKAWTMGGSIPIALASNYVSIDRRGVMTPDETVVHDSPISFHELQKNGFHAKNVRNLYFEDCQIGNLKIERIESASFYQEDGLILSFCHALDPEIARRLEKSACVRIYDIHALKSLLDDQLGVNGLAGPCRYTADHQRGHFLKSAEDSWQKEYRFFWPLKEPRDVLLPPGVAIEVPLGANAA